MDNKRTALPLQNSQYWGAALNNYLRHIDTNIAGLEEQMNNFKIATSYDGSGFIEGYGLSIDTTDGVSSNWVQDGNGNITCKTSTNDLGNLVLVLQGNIFFTKTGNRKSDIFTWTDSSAFIKINFRDGSDGTGNNFYCKYITKDETKPDTNPSYSVVHGDFSSLLTNFISSRNYFPLYIHRRPLISGTTGPVEQEGNQVEIVVGTYGYVYDSDYILFGVLEAFQDNKKNYHLKIIKKYDSSAKSIYETRRDNRESYATLLPNSTLYSYNNEGQLVINFGSANYIISTNGINTTTYTVESKDIVRDLDSKILYPLITSENNEWTNYLIIVKNQDDKSNETIEFHNMDTHGSSATLHYYKDAGSSYDADSVDSSIAGLVDETGGHHRLYGVYATISGEFIVEWSPINADVNTYNWRLPNDSNFDCGGLVFLGCFYLVQTENSYTWAWANSSVQGVKPTILSNNGIETTEFVNLNAIHYFYTLTNGSSPSFQWKFDNSPANNTYLHLNFPDNTTTKFYVPLFKDTDFEYSNESLKLRKLTITTDGISVDGNVAATGSVSGADATFTGNVVLGGLNTTITLKNSATIQGSVDANGYITSQTYGRFGSLKLSDSKIEYISNDTTKYDITLGDNNITFNGSLNISETDYTVTIKSDNKTLALQGKSDTAIQLNNNLNFTSDRRCKYDIRKVDDKLCYDAIRNIDVDLYKYIGQNIDNIGIIAQDLEQYLPQYKDVLIDIVKDGELNDKRTVSEIKLLFIIWSALKHLISKIEGSDK